MNNATRVEVIEMINEIFLTDNSRQTSEKRFPNPLICKRKYENLFCVANLMLAKMTLISIVFFKKNLSSTTENKTAKPRKTFAH